MALRSTPGNLGVLVLRRYAGYETEFTVLWLWTSEDAIPGFAGEDVPTRPYTVLRIRTTFSAWIPT